jgi:hypothetical protein
MKLTDAFHYLDWGGEGPRTMGSHPHLSHPMGLSPHQPLREITKWFAF